MIELFKIISKNFKLLIRSKSSALIIILGPLLVIFLVGIAFDNMNKFSLNIGTYSSGYSELSDSFIEKLKAKEFRVDKTSSEEQCIEKIKEGKLHTCIIFPPDLTIESGKQNEITFHVDYSKMNLIWMVLDTLSTKLDERSSELSLDLTENLLKKIESTRTAIISQQSAITDIKEDNAQINTKIAEFNLKVQELKTTSVDIRSFILDKVTGAKAEIESTVLKISDSNATESQINIITSSIYSIQTYLINIENKIQDPNDLTESDWSKINRLLDEITGQISSINGILSGSSSKIDDIQSSLTNIQNELSSIQVNDAATVVNPITTIIKPVVPEKTYLNYLFPSLIILVIMFISILLSTTLVMMEKHSPAYFRNFITPTRSITFIIATYLTNMIMVIAQIAIIIVISSYFFKAQVIPNLGVIILGLFLITTLFTFVGMIIGYIFTSEETATLASISIGSIFLFLSNVILPLESMPSYVRNIAEFNPFVLSESLLKKVMIFNVKLPELVNEFQWLAVYSAVLIILIWIIQKSVRKHLFHRLSNMRYKKHKKS